MCISYQYLEVFDDMSKNSSCHTTLLYILSYELFYISYVRTEKTSEVSGEHFTQKGHKLEHMKGLLIAKVHNPDPVALSIREKCYVSKFDTYKRGLNRE